MVVVENHILRQFSKIIAGHHLLFYSAIKRPSVKIYFTLFCRFIEKRFDSRPLSAELQLEDGHSSFSNCQKIKVYLKVIIISKILHKTSLNTIVASPNTHLAFETS